MSYKIVSLQTQMYFQLSLVSVVGGDKQQSEILLRLQAKELFKLGRVAFYSVTFQLKYKKLISVPLHG